MAIDRCIDPYAQPNLRRQPIVMSLSRRRVRFPSAGEAEVLTEQFAPPAEDELVVRTQYSAISPGTERLIYEGNVDEDMAADASIDALKGTDFSYPLSYGYACVGEVESVGEKVDEEWMGRQVFAFKPHVSRFRATPSTVTLLPPDAEMTDAVMIPTLETAVNLVMDGRPMIGERVVLFGQGVVGLLTTRLLADYPLATLATVERAADRREQSLEMGASVSKAAVSDVELSQRSEAFSGEGMSESWATGADLAYELTGHPDVLDDAIQAVGFGGRVVVGSWYGQKTASLDLGGHFHRSRIQITSSQVSTILPELQGRWTKLRRMDVVLNLLDEVSPGQLITDTFNVEEAPSVYNGLSDNPSMLQPIFVYE